MKVSLVTLTYNKADYMEALAKSLVEKCTGTPWQWVVLDNGSDDTLERLQNIDFRGNRVKYIQHNNAGNFSSMNNGAVRQGAEGETLIFLNNDMVAESDFVTMFHDALTKNPHVGAVGACLYYPNGSMQHCGVIVDRDVTPGNLGQFAHKLLGFSDVAIQPEYWGRPMVFQAVTGACLGMRMQDFRALGGFHDEFSWCFEDVDLCFRVRMLLDKICIVLPDAKLIHYESLSGGNRKVDFNLELLRGRWHGVICRDSQLFKDQKLLQSRLLRQFTA